MTRLLLVFFICLPVLASDIDPRYCTTEPVRGIDGKIQRSAAEKAKFRRIHLCPVTLKQTGVCKDWAVDHVIPLSVGGCDKVFNMQWLPTQIKSCPGSYCKDRWERTVYQYW